MAYATLEQVRGLDALTDKSLFPDELLTEAIAWAEAVIDTYCGAAFEPKDFTVTVAGHDRALLFVPMLFIQSITEVTVDGVTVDGEPWRFTPDIGHVWTGDAGAHVADLFDGDLVTVTGTAGQYEAAPPEISWAARTLARQYLLDLVSRVPDRAIQLQSEYGMVTMAQAGGMNRPTSLPEVNAVLNRHRHRLFNL